MPRKPSNRSMVTTLLGLLSLLVMGAVAILATAAPAAADDPCCQISVQNLPGQFQAGGDAKPFTLRVVNKTHDRISSLTVTFTFRANGLSANQMRLQRQTATGMRGVKTRSRHGAVTATDSLNLGVLSLLPGTGFNIGYRLAFDSKTRSAGLAVSARVQTRHGDAGAGPYHATIVGVAPPVTTKPTEPARPSPTPTISDTLTPTASSSESDLAAGEPVDQSTIIGGASGGGGGGSMIWLAYTIGALLLLGGIGVIGTLMWRRGPHQVETEWDGAEHYGDQPDSRHGYAPTRTMPAPAVSAPTTVMATPTQHDARGRHAAPTSQYPIPQDPYGR